MKYYSIILSLILTACVNGRADTTNQVEKTESPNASSIVIVLKRSHWTIEELNKTALTFVQTNKEMPKGLKFETIVDIYPDNKLTMCRFMYVQGFGRPTWSVEMGYDGKIIKSEKTLWLEKP